MKLCLLNTKVLKNCTENPKVSSSLLAVVIVIEALSSLKIEKAAPASYYT